jgi:hypothetical protein
MSAISKFAGGIISVILYGPSKGLTNLLEMPRATSDDGYILNKIWSLTLDSHFVVPMYLFFS